MTSNKKIVIFSHSGSSNHGCDALLRTISYQLKNILDNPEIIVVSKGIEQDKKAIQNHVDRYVPQYKNRYHPIRLYASLLKNLGYDKQLVEKIKCNHFINESKLADAAISIGGDTYFKGYNMYKSLYIIDREIKQARKKLILWGCSIEPNDIDDEMIKDLGQFDLILARESITYNALLEHNINKNTKLCPDPAFTMLGEELPLPKNWIEGNMVGLNISPLIMKYEKSTRVAFNSMHNLIEHILKKTDCGIALIPHVTWKDNNDLEPLKELYKFFEHTQRIVLVGEEYNAPQLKGFISRCRLFIGARTHAIIAAYSTNVPALAIGYSVKARGIARDLFDDENGLVLPVQELEEEQLVNAFCSLFEREKELRNHLQQIMPDYIKNASDAAKYVKEILE